MYEIAWAAGFFDGEGTTSYSVKYKITRIQISQKEPDLLHRFAEAVGTGVVCGPYKNGKGEVYQYRLSRKDDVVSVIAKLWPFLGNQKKIQARSAHVAPLDIAAATSNPAPAPSFTRSRYRPLAFE